MRHLTAHSALICAFICLINLPAIAQEERVYQSVRALTGKELRVGVFARVSSKDCKPVQIPEIQVTVPPKNGALTIRVLTVTTNRYPNCPNLKTPAQVLFYQSGADYTGPDSISFTVTFENGEKQTHFIAITVTKEGQASTPEQL